MLTKVCFKCLNALPLSEFYKHAQMKDGCLNKCKSCTRLDVGNNRRKKLSYYRAYDKARLNQEGRKQKLAERRKRWRSANPEKYRAHTLVNNAIRDGRLIKQFCVICGSENTDAHHSDYSKPFEIEWLCRACHLKRHGNYISQEIESG